MDTLSLGQLMGRADETLNFCRMEDAHHHRGDKYLNRSLCPSPSDPIARLMASLSEWIRVEPLNRVSTSGHILQEEHLPAPQDLL